MLIQDANEDNSVIGAGFFLAPAFSGSTYPEQLSIEFYLSRVQE